jgi:hypothetical protein
MMCQFLPFRSPSAEPLDRLRNHLSKPSPITNIGAPVAKPAEAREPPIQRNIHRPFDTLRDRLASSGEDIGSWTSQGPLKPNLSDTNPPGLRLQNYEL